MAGLVIAAVLLVVALVGVVVLVGDTDQDVATAVEEDRRARSERRVPPVAPHGDGSDRPVLGDHWHAAFGINVCGTWYPDPVDVGPDFSGIHTHEDGVIHIHPFMQQYTGAGATLGAFFDMVGIEVEPGEDLVFVQGMDLTPRSERCHDLPGRWVVARFHPDVDDEVVELVEDPAAFTSVRLLQDREAFTLAWLPEGEDVPPPPSVPMLDRLSDVPR